MKLSWILWWVISAFWIILFIGSSVMIWERRTDATGIFQTPELRAVSIIILAIAFLLPIIIQIVWLIINLIMSRNEKIQKY
ncbi:Uncharacterised protein [Staphylococcus petrasii]|uniref:DUF3923 family protein n=1 Tax=Staphylococcus petrasii TaxID=1276936 RepID=A0A380G2G3_9STAP|nr:DUF3923 family protein [Staphylococcus petrasii]PNZ27855.1 DUF3923 domain-containing protein [Staphylococcus petrasii]TGE12347.1 DUF3923 family protein [Staphylococcus petrasii]TGE17964.1 DUF3923 family protein [Staphylococcus petrasii]SUM45205.1 Uncharacterised protein [Staphylococcus petrasii]